MTGKAQNQGQVFLEGEGDGWYGRNKTALDRADGFIDVNLLCRQLASFKPEINEILEIGCSNGVKLEQLCGFFASSGKGVDPSAKAVDEGNARLRSAGAANIGLAVATAGALPFDRQQFDLVYFAFCLYLVDREDLFAAVAEADRVLKPGGFLAIYDFDPSRRHKREYVHRKGVFSYKQQYAELFTDSGRYHLVAKHSFSHGGESFVRDADERVSLCILYKEPDPY